MVLRRTVSSGNPDPFARSGPVGAFMDMILEYGEAGRGFNCAPYSSHVVWSMPCAALVEFQYPAT